MDQGQAEETSPIAIESNLDLMIDLTTECLKSLAKCTKLDINKYSIIIFIES